MPRADGLFETHLTVSDLERSVAFYRDVVGLPLALQLDERGAAFFWVGKPGSAMLGLWSLGSAPLGLSLHVAFAAPLKDVLAACEALRANGIVPLSFFGVETDEPSVIGWMPAAAVYFRDPDGHLIEYLAMLDEPPQPQRGILPWSAWTRGGEPVRVELHSGSREPLRTLFEEAEESEQELKRYFDAGEVLVAIKEGQVVGQLQLIEASPGATEINNLAVDPRFRRRGIGRTLVEAAIARARSHGYSTLLVATPAAVPDNLRFYQLAGFRMQSIQRDAFSPATGYASDASIDGIPLRDRVWFDLEL
jgi:lactoylglutathione lyase